MGESIPESDSVAILFADISGSTAIYQTLGDLTARQLVGRFLSILTDVIRSNQGTVIKTIGDEVMSTFPSAELAAASACLMQTSVARAAKTDRVALGIRIGIQFGPVIRESDDVYGEAVNAAARLVALAKAGEILTTKGTVVALPAPLRVFTRHINRLPLRGMKAEHDVYEVIWQTDNLTLTDIPTVAVEIPKARLVVTFRDKSIEVGPGHSMVTMGRGQQNDLIVPDWLASRLHARIEHRRGRFILVDLSINGTHVRTDRGEVVCLHREEMPLHGTGLISLGRPPTEDAGETIRFVCDG